MLSVRTAHTSELDPGDHLAVRQLLDEAFDGGFGDDDYEHGLGGVHVLVSDGGRLVGHGSVVMRRLLHGDRALRTGYVEGVGVRPDHRRRGVGSTVMGSLEELIRGAYELGALSASEGAVAFYAGRGWQRWSGTASVLAPAGITPTPGEEDSIFLLPVNAELAAGGDLACDWRNGDVW
jgi:aminoglycoside 2'-N-acetyltransferase I